jgi:hypothetical protein
MENTFSDFISNIFNLNSKKRIEAFQKIVDIIYKHTSKVISVHGLAGMKVIDVNSTIWPQYLSRQKKTQNESKWIQYEVDITIIMDDKKIEERNGDMGDFFDEVNDFKKNFMVNAELMGLTKTSPIKKTKKYDYEVVKYKFKRGPIYVV